jgi:hypothetical protein
LTTLTTNLSHDRAAEHALLVLLKLSCPKIKFHLCKISLNSTTIFLDSTYSTESIAQRLAKAAAASRCAKALRHCHEDVLRARDTSLKALDKLLNEIIIIPKESK